ncbi:rhodanese-like domain-containing protein [Hymenobacter jejuensis]|uniref:Rhodanese-like domain-containing protein n=1 Tax=Hymenobacter jejuensis TaxID=2502781 RepID=A0A5B8A6H6_9BACT|nr:rhodanese-like domain-containing protein [Hymenobacter jejuensis]QDA62286.1 rhodanese-like domain-containing protein [Hymenobacter jejuensis]
MIVKLFGRAISILVIVLASAVVPACNSDKEVTSGASPAYQQLLRTLYSGTVRVIQPAALADLLRQKPESVVVLDTRTPAEYAVSHLRGARFVNFDSLAKADFSAVPRNRTVVVYCSVGYRSEKAGERLKALGFKDIRNLYGGIFEWVNEGLPVYNQQGPTVNVHPYSPIWCPWLKRGNPVYE